MAKGPYKVVRCPRCGWLQVVMAEKATTCRRCGSTINLLSQEPLAMARTAQEAREALLRLKRARLKRPSRPHYGR